MSRMTLIGRRRRSIPVAFKMPQTSLRPLPQTYTGGPLTGRAHLLRGQALDATGDTAAAARAYLEAFSGAPQGPDAPAALLSLGPEPEQVGPAR